MKTILLSCLLLFIVINGFSSAQIRVGDPRNSWYTSQGTIEEASLTVRPKGLYMEYGLYLTFSPKGSYWTNPQDTLEVTLNFELPENAIVNDSWLWIGDNIIKAKLLDRWTASAIYEDIVKRRRDPSILMKQSATQYELRVFPMAGNQTRKVKINYLMPMTWSKTNVAASLPTEILNSSLYKPSVFPVYTWTNEEWKLPAISGNSDIKFVSKNDETLGDYQVALIPSSVYENNNNLKVNFSAPLLNGIYFSPYQQTAQGEGIYQLAIFPDQFFNATVNKKTAILIDYDASNANITSKELLNSIKNEMLQNLSAKDSFNLIFSNLSIKRYSNQWIAASSENIETAFNSLNNPLSSYSNLGALLSDGIDFVKKNGNNGKIILISDADQYGDFKVGNTLVNDLIKLMNPKIPIHIADYQSINYPYYYNNGQSYNGNDYFYINLSRMTLGSYHTVRNNSSLSDVISGAFRFVGGAINSFDMHTSMKTGFCYSRYSMNSGSNIAYVNDAILQVGKFKGEFPFLIEVSGEYNNEIFSETIEVPKPESVNNDTIAETIWAGQYIKKLESQYQSNDIINEIIFASVSERVLSKYTSFICLEDTSYICNNCKDESKPIEVGTEDVAANPDSLQIYPNPFVDKVTISLMCSDPDHVKQLSIVDVTGAIIYQFNIGELHQGKNIISWDGTSTNGNKVKPGIYILVYKTSVNSQTIKVIKR
ncbi:MAG: VIT domain-containing protein [Candidatus Saccharibacteria bacterium]